jgi:hypothetical protein
MLIRFVKISNLHLLQNNLTFRKIYGLSYPTFYNKPTALNLYLLN